MCGVFITVDHEEAGVNDERGTNRPVDLGTAGWTDAFAWFLC